MKQSKPKQKILESDIENTLRTRVEELDGLYYKFVSPQHNGVPDRIVICRGGVYFVELKRPGEKPRLLQQRVHLMMRRRGAHVITISSFEEIELFFNYLKRQRNRKSTLTLTGK